MTVTLTGRDTVTLAVDVRAAARTTPVLMVTARGMRNPRGTPVYVQVLLAAGDRENEIGSFTFFGAPPDADREVFAFALDADQARLLANHGAQIRAVLRPIDPGSDVSDVQLDLSAWVEASRP